MSRVRLIDVFMNVCTGLECGASFAIEGESSVRIDTLGSFVTLEEILRKLVFHC